MPVLESVAVIVIVGNPTAGHSRASLETWTAVVAVLGPALVLCVLGARVVAPWPGSKDPEDDAQASRRRMSPAGVPDPDVWGEREVGDPANADEVVAALSGGRVRRRR